MQPLYSFLDTCRDVVRGFMNGLARVLNKVSGGKLSPNAVTLFSLVMHIPIAWLIAQGYFGYAAAGLVVFGLFDALDGALARLQGKASNAGMLLDASTDRMKEVLLYMGAAFALAAQNKAYFATWAVAACGGSLLVSYVKAKGETAVKDSKLSANQINRLLQDGLMRYEIRMFVLVIGLLADRLPLTLIVIAVTAWATAFGRLLKISRSLS
jgi:phosphatidylglycerophosphate synthase